MSLPKLVRLTERRDGKDQPVLINPAQACYFSTYPIPITGTPLVGTPETKQRIATVIQFAQGPRIVVVETVEEIIKQLQQQ